jgi:hypothetical protein
MLQAKLSWAETVAPELARTMRRHYLFACFSIEMPGGAVWIQEKMRRSCSMNRVHRNSSQRFGFARWNVTSGRVANQCGMPPDFRSSLFDESVRIVFGEADPPLDG